MATAYPGSRYNDLYAQYPQKPQNPVDQIGPGLDTANPRPSYQAVAGGTGTATQTAQQQQAAPAAPGSGSPELAGLKHSSQAPVTGSQTSQVPAYLQPLVNAIPGLTQPTGIDPAVANQVARQNQMSTNIAANEMREKMAAGTGGLARPGESGLADTALGGIYRAGAANTARTLGDMSAQLPQLNLQRLLAAGQLGQMVSGEDLARQQFGYGQEMDALQMLMNLYGAEQGYQQSAWSPYYTGIVNAYGK